MSKIRDFSNKAVPTFHKRNDKGFPPHIPNIPDIPNNQHEWKYFLCWHRAVQVVREIWNVWNLKNVLWVISLWHWKILTHFWKCAEILGNVIKFLEATGSDVSKAKCIIIRIKREFPCDTEKFWPILKMCWNGVPESPIYRLL